MIDEKFRENLRGLQAALVACCEQEAKLINYEMSCKRDLAEAFQEDLKNLRWSLKK